MDFWVQPGILYDLAVQVISDGDTVAPLTREPVSSSIPRWLSSSVWVRYAMRVMIRVARQQIGYLRIAKARSPVQPLNPGLRFVV